MRRHFEDDNKIEIVTTEDVTSFDLETDGKKDRLSANSLLGPFSKRFDHLFSMCMCSECHSMSFPVQTNDIIVLIRFIYILRRRVDVNKPVAFTGLELLEHPRRIRAAKSK